MVEQLDTLNSYSTRPEPIAGLLYSSGAGFEAICAALCDIDSPRDREECITAERRDEQRYGLCNMLLLMQLRA